MFFYTLDDMFSYYKEHANDHNLIISDGVAKLYTTYSLVPMAILEDEDLNNVTGVLKLEGDEDE